jgi:hypothetical protein
MRSYHGRISKIPSWRKRIIASRTPRPACAEASAALHFWQLRVEGDRAVKDKALQETAGGPLPSAKHTDLLPLALHANVRTLWHIAVGQESARLDASQCRYHQ